MMTRRIIGVHAGTNVVDQVLNCIAPASLGHQQRFVHRLGFFGQSDLLFADPSGHPNAIVADQKDCDQADQDRVD